LLSVTFTSKTYVQATKLVTLVSLLEVFHILAVEGPLTCFQVYDVIVPSLSLEADALRFALELGKMRTKSTPAFAIGAIFAAVVAGLTLIVNSSNQTQPLSSVAVLRNTYVPAIRFCTVLVAVNGVTIVDVFGHDICVHLLCTIQPSVSFALI